MKIIAPSILSADLSVFGKEIEMLDKSEAEWIHVDVMDGHFVPNLTFGPNIVEATKKHTDKYLDVHLMVEEPEKMVDAFIGAGSSLISIHAEATEKLEETLKHIKEKGADAGVVIKPETSVQEIESVLPLVDLVLVMTVNPGFGGQSFMDGMLDKIKELDAYRADNDLDFLIEVDGGVNDETILLCHEAGADVFVAGSNVFGAESPTKQITKLKNSVNE